ncbi:MAG TPA: iron-sulfur cluster-binding domain-containing protein [Terriglobales bacterium]|jgi:ferredoxin-NADP reductase|nr:iron-sulfur cluster-binding domain-containing protein [Terriglobales bacterium]
MHTSLSIVLSSLFVLLGGFNTWLMLGKRNGSTPGGWSWVVAHRIAGYLFIAIYSVMLYYMTLRMRSAEDELPARLVVHVVLALLLAPLLAVKIIVARHQKGSQNVLSFLGIAIFAISFTLVALNIIWHVLRAATGQPVSPVITALVLTSIFVLLGTLLLRRPGKTASRPVLVDQLGNRRAEDRAKIIADHDPPAVSLVLSRVQPQTHDSKTLRFIVPQNRRWDARPGQFLAFEWNIDGKKITRSYSICSSPTQRGYVEITPKRAPNGCVSVFLNDCAHPGLIVTARGPYGQFCFDERQHRSIVLVAGGSGITPMMSMLRYIDDLCLPVEVTLIYCVRTLQDVFFAAELSSFESSIRNFRRILVLSQPHSDWTGARGHLNRELIERNVGNVMTSTVFLCGPPPFMESARAIFVSLGVDPANVMQESFGSHSAGVQTAPLERSSFQVDFARTGKTGQISGANTLLETAEMNGISLPYGCRQGCCGTCATRLLHGEVQMEREDGLEPELKAQGYILPCVSRACSDIKLDA